MFRTPNGYMEQMSFVDFFKTLYVHSVCQSTGTAFKKHKAYFVPLHEGEYIVIRQTLKAGIVLSEETERQTEHVTGIVTSDSATEKIKARPNLVQSGGH